MKLKGVNPIEQHIEKIVLAVVLILLLAVLSMQFVLRPNDIEVSSTRTVSPDQVYTVLESQANQLQSQLSDQSPALPELQPVDLVERYNNAFENSSGGAVQLSSSLGQGVDIAVATGTRVEDIDTPSDGPVAALRVPRTSTPVAASLWSTLDPYAVIQVPAYEQYIPATQPFDFPSISIEASFSGKDLESALLGKNGSDSAIPPRFWSATGLAILGFEAERQQLMEDGSWGSSEPIETPPHTPKPTHAIGEDAGLLELTALVSTAAGVVDEVARPMFPPTISGEEWIPPSERVESGDDSESAQIKRIQRRLDRARSELERLTNAPSGRQAPGQGPGKTSRTRDPQPSTSPGTNRSQQDRISKLRDDIKEYEKELKDLGVDLDDAQSSRRVRTSKRDVGSVLEEESVELWAHDLGVEPGATYRYRTRVVVNNPLFRKGGELDPDDAAQQALTTDPFARGEWSPWSDSVVAGAKEYFFVTGAETNQGFGSGGSRATIELYKMFYGHYRKSTLSVSPGDELATTVRMSGDLLNFDTALVEVAEAAEAIEGLADEDSSGLPEGISEISNRISIDLGVYLLDIYAGQGGVETDLGRTVVPMQIVLRDSSGALIVRSDLGDESSLAFALASQSASVASHTALRAPGAPAISPAAELFKPKAP